MKASDFTTGGNDREKAMSNLLKTEKTDAVNTGLVEKADKSAKALKGDLYSVGKKGTHGAGSTALDAIARKRCATWTTMVYARAGHAVGGNGNTQLGNQGYGANYSQKRATTDLSQINVGMLISAQYGSNTAAGNAYGHVGIYIGDGKVMDSIYSGLRTISLSDWVSQNGRGWVVCGYPWDWR